MKGAGTIQGWKLFKGENYLRKFGTHNIVCENARILLQKIFYPIVWGGSSQPDAVTLLFYEVAYYYVSVKYVASCVLILPT